MDRHARLRPRLSLIRAATEGTWRTDAYDFVVLAGFTLAFVLRHGGLQLLALEIWVGWWLHPFGDWYLWGLLAVSVYVLARAIAAVQREGFEGIHPGAGFPLERWPETAELTRRERRLVLARAMRRLPRRETARRLRSELSVSGLVFAVALLEVWLAPDGPPRTPHLAVAVSPLVAAAASVRLHDPLRSLLAREILPEFWKQPWLWDRARREALSGRTVDGAATRRAR